MGVVATSRTSLTVSLGNVWRIDVEVRDVDGVLVDAVPTITVTLPAGSTATPTVETRSIGCYRATYTLATVGRYVASAAATGYGVATFTAYVQPITTATGMPTLVEVDAYLGENSWDNDQVQDALDAEAAAQRQACTIGAVYPPDLREALLRRVAVNLARRRVLLASDPLGDIGAGPAFVPRNDAEVRRLEAPYRRLVAW